jgi:hypothetical protein
MVQEILNLSYILFLVMHIKVNETNFFGVIFIWKLKFDTKNERIK